MLLRFVWLHVRVCFWGWERHHVMAARCLSHLLCPSWSCARATASKYERGLRLVGERTSWVVSALVREARARVRENESVGSTQQNKTCVRDSGTQQAH